MVMHSCPLIAGSLEQTLCAKICRLLSQLFQCMLALTRLPPNIRTRQTVDAMYLVLPSLLLFDRNNPSPPPASSCPQH